MRQGVGFGKGRCVSLSSSMASSTRMRRKMDNGDGAQFDPTPQNTVCATEVEVQTETAHALIQKTLIASAEAGIPPGVLGRMLLYFWFRCAANGFQPNCLPVSQIRSPIVLVKFQPGEAKLAAHR